MYIYIYVRNDNPYLMSLSERNSKRYLVQMQNQTFGWPVDEQRETIPIEMPPLRARIGSHIVLTKDTRTLHVSKNNELVINYYSLINLFTRLEMF